MPATPPSWTNSVVAVRHQSPRTPAGVRSRSVSNPGTANWATLTAAVTMNTTDVRAGSRRIPSTIKILVPA